MRTLEEIAENPRDATISENLIFIADPYNEFKGHIPQEVMDLVIGALKEKFVQGGGLVSRFRSDLISLESEKTLFTPYEIEDFYKKLEIVMKTRPTLYVQKLMKLWKTREKIKKEKIKLDVDDASAFELVPYTHQWRHHIEKKKDQNPFEALKKISDYGITLHLRQNPNKWYPNYLLYGWQEKLKTRENIVNKLLYKIFKNIGQIDEKVLFYERAFGSDFMTDYFGTKVIGVSFDPISFAIGNLLHNNPNWVVVSYEDYTMSKGGRIKGGEYILKQRNSQSTEDLQLQVTSLTNFLLDDFFKKDSHPRYKLRRNSELRGYERENKRLYGRMEGSMNDALSFLPR